MIQLDFSLPTLASTYRTLRPTDIDGVAGWYDPSDITTLFQDAAMTIPVTADGQAVGAIADKSGAGQHLKQSIASTRPIYHTDGTGHWLTFDGVDDKLLADAVFTIAGPSIYMGVACSFPGGLPSVTGAVLSNSNYLKGGAMVGWQGAVLSFVSNSDTVEAANSIAASSVTAPFVMSLFTGVGSKAYASFYGGKAAPADNAFAQPRLALTLGKGTQGGRTGYFAGRFYGAVFGATTAANAGRLNSFLKRIPT